MVVTLSYYPLVYLPTVASLRRLDPAVEEVATALGKGGWQVFWRVTLPAISPAVLGGALLVGLHLLAEYGALQPAQLPDPDDRDPPAVRHGLQRPRGHPAGAGAGHLLPAPARHRGPAARSPSTGPRGRGREPRGGPDPARAAPAARAARPRRAGPVVAGRPARQPGAVAGPRHLDRVGDRGA
ncbi:ABC transporter permease subunit [Nocardioides convexus]|uniref:ABC transporter permease subunit n=1 Tax=Nocardioides convexus TaxID=2712224 RepID=UPI0024185401|nr:ABC transporter permease subunit [Nocardioides convexus]